jgi:hypothetical protein
MDETYIPDAPVAAQEPLPPAVAFPPRGNPSQADKERPLSTPAAQEGTMDERMRILKMVEEGKISASEGASLLGAMGSSNPVRSTDGLDASAAGGGKWLKIRVTDNFSGKTRVNVTLPIGLVHVALRVGSRFVPDREREVVDEIGKALSDGLTGRIVDVYDEADGERVEIFIE